MNTSAGLRKLLDCSLIVFGILSIVPPATAAGTPAPTGHNPFAKPSSLPFQLPPFGQIRDTDYLPAFKAAMVAQLHEVQGIVRDPAAPTFDNTIVALERSGAMLNRVEKVFFNLTVSNGNPELEQVEQDMAPRLAAHGDAQRAKRPFRRKPQRQQNAQEHRADNDHRPPPPERPLGSSILYPRSSILALPPGGRDEGPRLLLLCFIHKP